MIQSVDSGLYEIIDLPTKRKKKPVYMKHYSVALLPRTKKNLKQIFHPNLFTMSNYSLILRLAASLQLLHQRGPL